MINKSKSYIILFIKIILPLFALSFRMMAQYNDLKFDHITLANGLSNSDISSITQDEKGFIWFGTADGLNKYDGYNFKVYKYNFKNQGSITNNTINFIFLNSKKDLWIGTASGISRYDDKDEFINYFLESDIERKDISLNRVVAAVEDSRGKFYIINEKGRLYLLDTVINQFIRQTDIQMPPTRTLAIDENDNLWIGTFEGLYFYETREKKITNYGIGGNSYYQVTDFINSICAVNNLLWIGTVGAGIKVLDRYTGKIKHYKPMREGDSRVYQVYKDKSNNIWVGDAEGLKYYDKNNDKFWGYYSSNDNSSLLSSGVQAIMFDKQGNLWAGSKYGGINVAYTNKKFIHIGVNPEACLHISKNIVSSIYEDNDGNVWVGSFNEGIDVLNMNKGLIKHYDGVIGNPNSLKPTTIHTIFGDSKNNIWIGSYLGGMQKYVKDIDGFKNYYSAELYPEVGSSDVRSIAEDKQGNLWLITQGKGAVKFDPTTRKIQHLLNTSEGKPYCFPDNWGGMFFIDSEDLLWAALPSGLALISKEGTTQKYYQSDPNNISSLSNNYVISIAEDSDSALWIGTADGLNYFNKKSERFIRFTKNEGLANSSIKGIIKDRNGDIWVSTNKGISRITFSDDSKSGYSIKNFDVRDGLQGDEFFERAYCISKKTGRIFFGGNNGITTFFPDSIKDNPFIPPIILTDFKLFYKSVPIDEPGSPLKKSISQTDYIELSYSQNVFTIEFVALNYIIPEKNQYSYYLEGFDKKWNNVGTEHKATYTNLNPGNYVFRVRASNNDGVWNEKGIMLKIHIKSPFWLRWWAIIIYFIIFLVLFYFVYQAIITKEKFKSQILIEKLEAKKAHEIDELKTNFFTGISHEFRTPLTLILDPLQKLIKENDTDSQTKKYYKLIYQNAHRLSRLVNQLLDFRKIEAGYMKLEATYGDIISFIKGVAGAFNHTSSIRNIKLNVVSDEDILYAWFDPDKLDKILYNLISNAFKFSPDGSEIDIEMAVETSEGEKKEIAIRIVDNGIGIPKESLDNLFNLFYQAENKNQAKIGGTGIGLALTKELVELHKGRITVDSSLGTGTCFTIYLPLGNEHISEKEIATDKVEMTEEINTIDPVIPVKVSPIINQTVENISKPLVLIIEDVDDFRQYLNDVLKVHYNVIEAVDGNYGYELAIRELPDLIVSDIIMPLTDGFKLTRMLKNDERTCHIPIILLTGKQSEESKIIGFETGADEYLTKPFSSDLLLARIKNLVSSRTRLKEIFGKTSISTLEYGKLKSQDKAFFNKAIKIVEEHLSDINFDASVFASELNMSRVQLYRKFAALTDQSVSDFFKNIRLRKAADMLINESKTIAEVAYAVGFSEPTNFTRTFAKHFGVTPTKYILQNKDNQ